MPNVLLVIIAFNLFRRKWCLFDSSISHYLAKVDNKYSTLSSNASPNLISILAKKAANFPNPMLYRWPTPTLNYNNQNSGSSRVFIGTLFETFFLPFLLFFFFFIETICISHGIFVRKVYWQRPVGIRTVIYMLRINNDQVFHVNVTSFVFSHFFLLFF